MTIFELFVPAAQGAWRNERPFVYSSTPTSFATGEFWTTALGAPSQSDSTPIVVKFLHRDGIYHYSEADSLADCLLMEMTFFWDATAQRVYVHIEHDMDFSGHVFQYGKILGFSRERAIYIDDIFYSPVIESVPSLAQTQDLEAYDSLAFISGSVKLRNHSGELDFVLDAPCFGYDCTIARIEDIPGVDDYERSDITYFASLYVEDQSASLSSVDFNLQDRRKAQNIKIPSETYTAEAFPDIEESLVGTFIPLMYGPVRAANATCVNSLVETGDVVYSVAQELSSVGTVQVHIVIDEVDEWVDVTPTSSDLAHGTFTLSDADGRDSDGVPYECKVLNPIGVACPHASDIIKALNLKYLGIQYLESEYDTAEWEAAEAELCEVGIMFTDQVELYEAIRLIQGGANVGFRYEFKPSGQRTIRIEDLARTASFRICVEDIANLEEMDISTDSTLIAASVKLNYAVEYIQNESLSVIDTSRKEAVQLACRQSPQLEFDSFVQTEALARLRASTLAQKYGTARGFLSLAVRGSEFLGLRIYDVGIIETSPGGYDADLNVLLGDRKWAGTRTAIVLDIDPDSTAQTNALRLALIDDITGGP